MSEQLLYTRPELERHKRTGDTEGPLAESGFRGHAHCRFCRRYFFGDNELFAHMQTGHEHCFLCRRARPDKYVYYADYAELEGADPERPWSVSVSWAGSWRLFSAYVYCWSPSRGYKALRVHRQARR